VLTTRLGSDDSFAETCLLEQWNVNPFLAKAGTDCELWFLTRSIFNRLVEDFPHVKVQLKEFAVKAATSRKRSVTVLTNQTVLLQHEMLLLKKKRKEIFGDMFIHPDGLFIKVWLIMVFLFIMYCVFVTPFRIAFGENSKLR
tara:strand:- start:707 stop:1132 length:426 start_codon:yes stop_codon:yes gene_type:complete